MDWRSIKGIRQTWDYFFAKLGIIFSPNLGLEIRQTWDFASIFAVKDVIFWRGILYERASLYSKIIR